MYANKGLRLVSGTMPARASRSVVAVSPKPRDESNDESNEIGGSMEGDGVTERRGLLFLYEGDEWTSSPSRRGELISDSATFAACCSV